MTPLALALPGCEAAALGPWGVFKHEFTGGQLHPKKQRSSVELAPWANSSARLPGLLRAAVRHAVLQDAACRLCSRSPSRSPSAGHLHVEPAPGQGPAGHAHAEGGTGYLAGRCCRYGTPPSAWPGPISCRPGASSSSPSCSGHGVAVGQLGVPRQQRGWGGSQARLAPTAGAAGRAAEDGGGAGCCCSPAGWCRAAH